MSDSSSEEVVAPTKAAAKPAVVLADSDSSDEVAAPKAKASVRPTFETDSEDESVPAKPAPKAKAAASEDSSDDEAPPTRKIDDKAKVIGGSDSDSDDDAEKKAAAKKKTEWMAKKQEDKKAQKAVKEASTDPKDIARKEKAAEARTDWRVYIAGLPWKLTDEAVKKEFSKCGEVKSVKMMLDEQGRSKGMAFVTFSTPEGMKAALQRDGDVEKYPGRALKVSKAKSEHGPERKKELEGNEKKRKEAKKAAKQAELREIRLPDPKLVGEEDIITNSFIRKLTIAQEQKDFSALEVLGKKICKRARMAIDAKEKAQTQKSNKKADSFTVFIKGLPATDFNEEAFRKRFQDCGSIKFLWKPVKPSGENKGFGTVAFKNDEALQKALKYNGTKCGDNVLSVVKSVAKDERTKTEENGKDQKSKDKKDKKRKDAPDAEAAPEAKKKKHEEAAPAATEEPPRKDKSEKKAKKSVEVAEEPVVKKKKKAAE